MEKRRFMRENKGYTLIEMIIVIAIVAVLTGAAMVTISIIHSAKAKEASSTLEDALGEAQMNAKGKMCVAVDPADPSAGKKQQPDYRFALCVYKSGSKYYVKKGYYFGNGADITAEGSYDFPADQNVGSGKGTSFSAYVKVTYVDDAGTEREIADSTPVYIIYDRQGMCTAGYGKFKFYKSNKNVLISTVSLNKNGSYSSN